MVDYGSFAYGGATYPLPTSTASSLLKDADPSLYYVIDYFQSVLTTYLGPRLLAECANSPVINAIASPVQAVVPYDPSPFMNEQQLKFPLLAVYRKKDKFAWKTIAFHDDASEWCVDYILPPLTAGQTERIGPILRSVGAILQNRIENMMDPFYQNGTPIWQLAGLEAITLDEAAYGGYQGTGNLNFPAWRGKLTVKEIDSFTNQSFQKLTGIDDQLDLSGPNQPVLPDFYDATTEFTDPTLNANLVFFVTGDKNVTLDPDGVHVTTWGDQTVNGNNATQATLANKPRILQNALRDAAGNAKAVLRFDGALSNLVASCTQLANNTSKTFLAMFRLSDTLKRSTVFAQTLSGDTGAATSGIEANTASSAGGLFGFFADSSSFDSPKITDGQWHVIAVTETNTTSGGTISSTVTYQVDNSAPQVLTTKSGAGTWSGMATSNQLALGGIPTLLSTTALSGDIGVAMAFNTALTTAQVTTYFNFCKQWAGQQ